MDPARMNGPRARTRSERMPARTVRMQPMALGGTERSWAVEEAKPSSAMMVGRKRTKEIAGMRTLGDQNATDRWLVTTRHNTTGERRRDGTHKRYMPLMRYVCGSRRACQKNFHLKVFERPAVSFLIVSTSQVRSASVRNLAFSGYYSI